MTCDLRRSTCDVWRVYQLPATCACRPVGLSTREPVTCDHLQIWSRKGKSYLLVKEGVGQSGGGEKQEETYIFLHKNGMLQIQQKIPLIIKMSCYISLARNQIPHSWHWYFATFCNIRKSQKVLKWFIVVLFLLFPGLCILQA